MPPTKRNGAPSEKGTKASLTPARQAPKIGVEAVESDKNTQNNISSARRESEMTVSMLSAGHADTSTMITSRSFPGSTRTPIRRSPLPYSPRSTTFTRDISKTLLSLESPAVKSPLDHEAGDTSKLRSLALAAAYPLNDSESPKSRPASTAVSPLATGLPRGLDSLEDFNDADLEDYSFSPSRLRSSAIRHSHRFSRGSSHNSFPSNMTTISTRSTRSTSLYSSQSRIRLTSTNDDSDSDAEEDRSLGRRFWTQLSNLGEQVSRENKERSDRRRHNARNVSITSIASSETSVFSYSPLGILVPADSASSEKDDTDEDSRRKSDLQQGFLNTLQPGNRLNILGRRRAYSSMVPLTGWHAGDGDMSTLEAKRELPQVLVINPRGSGLNDADDENATDLVTPTVANFHGRARAMSFQPPSASTKLLHSAVGPRQRQNIWEEAMHQLTEQIARSRRQIPANASAQMSPKTTQDIEDDACESLEDVGQGPKKRSSRLFVPSSDPWSPSKESSPLPGLFYDNWVERVDGAVDGELGRRGSTFHAVEGDEEHQGTAKDATVKDAISRSSPTKSCSTMLSSDEGSDELSLQVLHESEWPLPQSRPETNALLSASSSFFSVLSPQQFDEKSDADEDMDNYGDETNPVIPLSSRPGELSSSDASIPEILEPAPEADGVRSLEVALREPRGSFPDGLI